MSQDAERLLVDLTALADPRYGLARGFDDAQATLNDAIREVRELRHLRDNVVPNLQEELGMANAYIADFRKLVGDLRAIPMQDDGDPYDVYADAYNEALRGVARMIDEAGL